MRLANTSGPLAGARLTLQVDGRLLAGARDRLLRVLLVTAAVALIVVAAGVPLVVRFALSPLHAMTRLARDVTAGRRGRRFVADAAHELRTPVAGIGAAAEAVLQYPEDGPPEPRQKLR